MSSERRYRLVSAGTPFALRNSRSTPSRARLWVALLFFVVISNLCGCSGSTRERCITCHRGIEHTSPTHSGCVSCHGGNPAAHDRKSAHAGLFGPSNPSAPQFWLQSCGRCHQHQLQRVDSGIMRTNAGMIRNIQLTWEGMDGRSYTVAGGNGYAASGQPAHSRPVEELDNLSGELYRKFCSRCHVGSANPDSYAAAHGSGCAACHFPWNDEGIYRGSDRTVAGTAGHSASHAMEALPGTRVCSRCHNRSGRIAYSYQGLHDGNNSLVPTRGGEGGPLMVSGARTLTSIAPDVHHAAGLECIDCHTARDVMGDGYLYRNMYQQTEIACEDCHGSPTRPPRHREVRRENEPPLRESRSYRRPVTSGMHMVLTSRGTSYSNVFVENGAVWLQGKRSGQLHRARVITGTPEHTIAGHGRMECHSCHSRSSVQCYGCHTRYDKAKSGMDFISGEETPGAFSESEDYRMLYPFPLALNQRGRISPVTPGCQTFVTVDEADGTRSKGEYVTRFKGSQQLRFAPFYSHNTGKKAIGCTECHANPRFFGFGQGVLEGASYRATLICERSDTKPLDGFLALERGIVRPFSAVTRENSRPLNGAELKRAFTVNLCLPCHESAADPIYRKELQPRVLEDRLHRRLLGGR